MVPQSTDDSSRLGPTTRKQTQQQAPPSLAAQAVHPDILDILYTSEAIRARTAELGAEIATAYRCVDSLAVLGVLTGAFVFCSDLVRAIHPVPGRLTVDFIRASSYGSGTESAGTVKVSLGADPARIRGKHVLLVEDIVDTALTITTLKARLLELGALSVKVATLLDKHERRQIKYTPDFVGFTCPNQFVVGYGLDFDDAYRSLPYIGVLRPEKYAHLGI